MNLLFKQNKIYNFYSINNFNTKDIMKNKLYSVDFLTKLINNIFYDYFGNKKLIGEGAPDTWMSGDINLLEYKNKMYEFGIATNKIDINYNNFEKRYEFKNDKSSKFWTIKYYKNGEFLTTYGKVGTKGKKSSKKNIKCKKINR